MGSTCSSSLPNPDARAGQVSGRSAPAIKPPPATTCCCGGAVADLPRRHGGNSLRASVSRSLGLDRHHLPRGDLLGFGHSPGCLAAGVILHEPDQRRAGQRLLRITAGNHFERLGRQVPAPAAVVSPGQLEQQIGGAGLVERLRELADFGQPARRVGIGAIGLGQDRLQVAPRLRRLPHTVNTGVRHRDQRPPRVASRRQHDAAKEIARSAFLRQSIDQQPKAQGRRRRLEFGGNQPPCRCGQLGQRTSRSCRELRGAHADRASFARRQRAKHLFDFPGLQAGPFDLLRPLLGLAGSLDGLQNSLGDQLRLRIGVRAGIGNQHYGRPPHANLPDQVRVEFVERASCGRSLPALDQFLGCELQARLADRKLPGRRRAAPPHANDGVVHGRGQVHVLAAARVEILPIEHVDHAQVAFLRRHPRDQLQRHFARLAVKGRQRRAPAAVLPLPRLAAVAGGQNQSQIANRPTAPLVDKGNRADRQALAGGSCLPGMPRVRRVQHLRAGRAGDPAVSALNPKRLEVELPGLGRQLAARRLPRGATVGRVQDRSAVAGNPGFGRAGQSYSAERSQADLGPGRFNRAAANRSHGASPTDNNAGRGVAEIAGQPALSVIGRQRAPASAAVVGRKHAHRKQR